MEPRVGTERTSKRVKPLALLASLRNGSMTRVGVQPQDKSCFSAYEHKRSTRHSRVYAESIQTDTWPSTGSIGTNCLRRWKTMTDLTDDEARYLAIHARYAAESPSVNPYYKPGDRARWMEISRILHPDPWGSAVVWPPPQITRRQDADDPRL